MPIYEYLCENGHRFDRLQKFSDDPVRECEVCGAPVQRVLHPVAVHFKGSGFYNTDYGRGRGGKTEAAKESGSGGDSASRNGTGSESGKSAAKAEAKASD